MNSQKAKEYLERTHQKRALVRSNGTYYLISLHNGYDNMHGEHTYANVDQLPPLVELIDVHFI